MNHIGNIRVRRGVHLLEFCRIIRKGALLKKDERERGTSGESKEFTTDLAVVIDHFQLGLRQIGHSSTDLDIELALLIGRQPYE